MPHPHPLMALYEGLADPATRLDAARAVAEVAGAQELIVFIRGAGGEWVPAPGFPRDLPHRYLWARFLAQAEGIGQHQGELPFADPYAPVPALAILRGRGALVLVGGSPDQRLADALAMPLSLLASGLELEHALTQAEARADRVQHALEETRRTAETLEEARQDLQNALREEELAQERLAILTEASETLGAELDESAALREIARLIIPALADCCLIFAVGNDDEVRVVDAAHVLPEKQGLLLRLGNDHTSPESALLAPLRHDGTRLLGDIPEGLAGVIPDHGERDAILEEFGRYSWLVVALRTRGRVLGGMVLGLSPLRRPFSTDDLTLLDDLAGRTAVAMENARLFQERERAIRLRDEFLSIASHELNTPLTALQLQIQLLRRHATRAGGSGSRLVEMANSVERHGKRLSGLVRDLLDVTRIEAGRLELERRETDLTEIVRDVVERHEVETESVGIAFESPCPVIGWWDPLRLDQVVTNLLSNAIKYGRDEPITVRVDRQGDAARLIVRDSGPGIAPEDRERIFGRFERLTAHRGTTGMGLGLFITRQIVDAHGGTIEVESTLGAGSTFVVHLPLETASPAG